MTLNSPGVAFSGNEGTYFITVLSSFPSTVRFLLPAYNASFDFPVMGPREATTAGPVTGVATVVGMGNPGDGRECKFPFVYNGETYTSCTCNGPLVDYWCATTNNLDRDAQWGFCDVSTFDADNTPCEDNVNSAPAERKPASEESVFAGYESAKPSQGTGRETGGSNSVATILSASLGAALLVVAVVLIVARRRQQRYEPSCRCISRQSHARCLRSSAVVSMTEDEIPQYGEAIEMPAYPKLAFLASSQA